MACPLFAVCRFVSQRGMTFVFCATCRHSPVGVSLLRGLGVGRRNKQRGTGNRPAVPKVFISQDIMILLLDGESSMHGA